MALEIFGQPIRTFLGPEATADRRQHRQKQKDRKLDFREVKQAEKTKRKEAGQAGKTERVGLRAESGTTFADGVSGLFGGGGSAAPYSVSSSSDVTPYLLAAGVVAAAYLLLE